MTAVLRRRSQRADDAVLPAAPSVVRRILAGRGARVAVAFIVLLVLLATFRGLLPLQDPAKQVLSDRLQSPSRAHWLGTDAFGRDTLSRLIYATRVSLVAALQATAVAAILGVPLGFIAGYVGRLADGTFSRIADALMSLPPLVLALAVIGALGPGLTNAMIAIGVVMAPRFFRVARVAALTIRHAPYIEASRSVGITRRRILFRHVLPNSSGPLMVQVSFVIGLAIISEASLSFLGLGVQPPTASWGTMTADAFVNIRTSSFGIYPPMVATTLTILAFFVIGDAARAVLSRDGALDA